MMHQNYGLIHAPSAPTHMHSNAGGYRWVHVRAGQPVPDNAVVGGRDIDGATIYVGRAHHEGDVIPAKVMPTKNVAYVAHGGREHAKSDYEMLVHEFTWVFCKNGMVPPNAVLAGHTSNREPLYVGRVYHAGSQTIGKVHPSHGCLYIPFNGKEISFRDYEVLINH